MENVEFGTFISSALGISILIAYFIVIYLLYSTKKNLEVLVKLELKKPENNKTIKCQKCGKESSVSVLTKGLIVCPECKYLYRVN